MINNKLHFHKQSFIAFFITLFLFINTYSNAINDTIPPRHKVTLREAHIGNIEIDTKLLDSYVKLPDNVRNFYFDSRAYFLEAPNGNFTDSKIIETAQKYGLSLIGGPMLGNLTSDGVVFWLRPSTTTPLTFKVKKADGNDEKILTETPTKAGMELRVAFSNLLPDTEYNYSINMKNQIVAEGRFLTAPANDEKGVYRIAFGSCFHKVGLHNPNLMNQIIKRRPYAMMLIGDLAADDRENKINMHRSDYLLRDVSNAWQILASNIPLYTMWDDHDYLNNDLGGIPCGFTEDDRNAVREVWIQNWNNPEHQKPGLNFNTRIGPVEIIMLDTRSCRENHRIGWANSFLGREQTKWIKETLKNSDAPFKIISSGTMWSDYMSYGKDSWGSWDGQVRDEIFELIEEENISGVLLISGDRHGARGFTIPRPSGFEFYEFEAASLGGVPGPEAIAKDNSNQLFGYLGADIIAFGEFTFDTSESSPSVIFRLIDEFGNILEEHSLPYSKLAP